MKQYELLLIVPGTMTEDEVAPHIAGVKELLVQSEATNMVESFLGKAKLAYPMQHIRYGYFYTLTFDIEPSAIPGLQQKLRLQKVFLRAMINEATPAEKLRDNAPKQLITIEKRQDLVDERKKAVAKFKGEAPLAVTAKKVEDAPKPKTEVAPTKEEKEEEKTNEAPAEGTSEKKDDAVSMEEIDKKLDKILAGEDIEKNV